jgi:hypothetical protein
MCYFQSIGGVAGCFHSKNRSGTPDIGAYANGSVTKAGTCTPPPPPPRGGIVGTATGGNGAGGPPRPRAEPSPPAVGRRQPRHGRRHQRDRRRVGR